MDCSITLRKLTIDITESNLIGICCRLFDTFGFTKEDLPCDIEISFHKINELLPDLTKSYTLYQKLNEIKQYCSSLKEVKSKCNEITANPNTKFRQTYYLPLTIVYSEFMQSYEDILYILDMTQEETTPYGDNLFYKSDWGPTDLTKCKLVRNPNENVENTKSFQLKVPCYLWDLPIEDYSYKEQEVSNMINLFLRDCFDEDHKLLLGNNYYLRIMPYQDNPNSERYVYMYLRNIDMCTYDSHKLALRSLGKDRLPCEINYPSRGYFFSFPVDQWKSKYVNDIKEFI